MLNISMAFPDVLNLFLNLTKIQHWTRPITHLKPCISISKKPSRTRIVQSKREYSKKSLGFWHTTCKPSQIKPKQPLPTQRKAKAAQSSWLIPRDLLFTWLPVGIAIVLVLHHVISIAFVWLVSLSASARPPRPPHPHPRPAPWRFWQLIGVL